MKESYTKYVERIEEANTKGCVETAQKNGHTIVEAEYCDNGSVGCPDCPFKLEVG